MMQTAPPGCYWCASDEIYTLARYKTTSSSGPRVLPLQGKQSHLVGMQYSSAKLLQSWLAIAQRYYLVAAFSPRPVTCVNMDVHPLGWFVEHFVVNLLLRTNYSSYWGNGELIFNLPQLRDLGSLYLFDANLQYQCQKRWSSALISWMTSEISRHTALT